MTRILALDPSTGSAPGSGCGVALIEYPAQEVLALTTIYVTQVAGQGDSALVDRVNRIRSVRNNLENYAIIWSSRPELRPTHIAYELPYRGTDTIETIQWLTGSLLSIPTLAWTDLVPISAAAAKRAWGGTGLKRDDAKDAVVRWANRVYGTKLALAQHDMADAIAVAEAAWSVIRAGQLIPETPSKQMVLSLPKSRKASSGRVGRGAKR